MRRPCSQLSRMMPADLAALAGAGAVAEHEAAAEADGAVASSARCGHDVEGLVDGPGAGEIVGMRLAGIDHGFELGVGQQRCRIFAGQMWPIARLGRRDRGHGRRLHQLCRMRLSAGNADAICSRVFFIDGIGQARALRRRPVERLIGQFDALRFGRAGRATGGTRGACDVAANGARRRAEPRRRRTGSTGERGGTCSAIQPSSVATSGAMPGEAGNAAGSSAGSLSMTVSRVSNVVPCLA